MTAIRLGQCSHTASSNLPGRRIRHHPAGLSLARTIRCAVPIRFCSRCGLPCRRRYRRRGALLPHLFTLTRRPRRDDGRFVLCGTFPGVAPAGRYPAPYVDGARTFLPGGLSAIAGAAVRPTDAPPMRRSKDGVKRRSVNATGAATRLTRVLRSFAPATRRAMPAGSPPSIDRRRHRHAADDSAAGMR